MNPGQYAWNWRAEKKNKQKMSNNVLIISASPRKSGNSDILCDQFRKGAEEVGSRVDKIRLARLSIDYCSACYACKKIGHCVHTGIRNDVVAKRKIAGYARVSTDSEEQLTSYEAQVDYYTSYIKSRPEWEFAGVYTDM